jgi:hypothetical protein
MNPKANHGLRFRSNPVGIYPEIKKITIFGTF